MAGKRSKKSAKVAKKATAKRVAAKAAASLPFRIVRSQIHEHADAPHLLALLRAPLAATPPPHRRGG
jgi:hypothetical protein